MKVYVIFDVDGWEIHGIEKIFSTKLAAISYLKSVSKLTDEQAVRYIHECNVED